MHIDLNCDMGEGMENDAAIMPYITSANIACGYHAGDEETMKRTVELCLQYHVAIGAHPSYPDRENFGRIDLLNTELRVADLSQIISDQVFKLQKICTELGTQLNHIKPHGALYNRAAKDEEVAAIICQTIAEIDPHLILYGLSGSKMMHAAANYNLKFLNEVFADRTYNDDGSLTPRKEPNALIEDEEQAVEQVLEMVNKKTVTTTSGKLIPIIAETICIHGDGKHAVLFAKGLSQIVR